MGSLQQLWYDPICGFERDGLSYFTAPSRILANLARESLRVRIAALAVSKPLMPQGVEHFGGLAVVSAITTCLNL